jgi:flavin-dependent dehydrogenase
MYAVYDVVIAGASFAGLAVASQVRGRVLLLDHQPIGEGQTSACGTTVAALEALGALSTIQQVHETLVLHLLPASGAERVLTYRLPYRYCTFDYRALCRLLGERLQRRGVEFRQARVLGWHDGVVETTAGAVQGRCVVDASGWRAVLASSIDGEYVRRDRLSCGLEAELPQATGRYAHGLHFWAGQGTIWPGYAWSFPCGETARLGVIAYGERSPGRPAAAPQAAGAASKGLREALDAFLDGPAAPYWSPDGRRPWRRGAGAPTAGRHLHGGFLPAAPRRPVCGPVFVVGDAAGQCFGLTGEGIRPALAFAVRCGQLLQQVVEGTLTVEQGRRRYAGYVRRRLPYFWLMRALQGLVSRMTDRGLARYSRAAQPGLVFRFLMGQYLWPADPAPLVRTASEA